MEWIQEENMRSDFFIFHHSWSRSKSFKPAPAKMFRLRPAPAPQHCFQPTKTNECSVKYRTLFVQHSQPPSYRTEERLTTWSPHLPPHPPLENLKILLLTASYRKVDNLKKRATLSSLICVASMLCAVFSSRLYRLYYSIIAWFTWPPFLPPPTTGGRRDGG